MKIFILLAACVAVASADNSYLFLTPKVIRPGIDARITVNVFKDDLNNPDVLVTAKLQKQRYTQTISTASGVFQKHVPGILKLSIPENISTTDHIISMELSEGPGHLVQDHAAVSVYSKNISVFIQTDKSMYKAGQTVNMRTFAMFPNGTIYTGAFKIEIYDPKTNKIKQWRNLQDTEYGAVSTALPMDDKPVLGTWKIKVTADGNQEEKTFKVSEYVLPKFEVSLNVPSFALTTDKEISGTVTAKYTYGRPASGTVKISVSIDPSSVYFPWEGPMYEQTMEIHGEAKFQIPLSKLQLLSTNYLPISENMDGHKISVMASVNEELNNKTRNASGTVEFRKEALDLKFIADDDEKYIPGLLYKAKIVMTEGKGRPPSKQLHPLNVTVYGKFLNNETLETDDVIFRKIMELQPNVPPSGLVELELDLPEAEEIHIKAVYDDLENTTNLTPYTDRTGHVQLSLLTSRHQVGGSASFLIKSTRPMHYMIYELYAGGHPVDSGVLDMMHSSELKFSVNITHAMAPLSRCIVYYMDFTGEVVADMKEFSVSGALQNKVSLNFDRTSVQPGDGVTLVAHADPASLVNILAVDQSVLLLGTGHDISEGEVISKLQGYNTQPSHDRYYTDSAGHQQKLTSLHPQYKFDEVGTHVLTDATRLYLHSPAKRRIRRQGAPGGCDVVCPPTAVPGMPMPEGTPMPFFPSAPAGLFPTPALVLGFNEFSTIPPTPASKPLMKVDKVRTDFPETWLWVNKTTGADGSVTFTTKAPDSITSWVASAFALNKLSGLGIASSHAKIDVFRPFFISLNLPFSVVRGEELVLQVNIFNYMSADVTVLVTLEKNDDFKNIVTDANDNINYISETSILTVVVKAGEAGSAYFPIVPAEVGQIDISVKAQSTIAADGVKRKLRVVPEGVEKQYNIPLIVDLSNATDFQATVPIHFPDSTVAGSERVDINVIGNVMGSTVKGLDKLLRLPTGCGEQTMIGLAPDIYVLDYLQSSGQLTDAVKDKAVSFMEKGYQRELTFQHRDGSFSAFGESDRSGSTWLTAFVVKSFHQAGKYITVDEEILAKALRWIIYNQNRDGSFNEPGHIIHTSQLKGGVSSGVGLTAFVTLALVENHLIPMRTGVSVPQAIDKARLYLESQLSSLTDPYVLAIASYALELAGSQHAASAFQSLDALAVVEDETRHWESKPKTNNYLSWSPPHQQADPINIEATAYALLYHAHKTQYIEGAPIMNWLLQQRNSNGGFASTQDTVLALQALSMFSGISGTSATLNTQIDITGDNFTHKFTVNDMNAMVLQSYKPQQIPSSINVSATGSGVSLLQVSVDFNVEAELEHPSFEVNVHMVKETLSELTVRSCTRYLQGGKSGMTVMELGIPTGFEADLESVTQLSTLKKSEEDDRKVNFYFDEIDTSESCVQIALVRTDLVAKSKPIPVRVYDYYTPDNQVTGFYESQLLKTTTFCDVCPDCKCPKSHKRR